MQQFGEFVVNHWDLFLALFIILAMMFAGPFIGRLRGFSTIEPTAAVRLINHDDAIVLDVREQNEVSGGSVIDSVHIPLGALKSRLAELEKHKQQPIIVGCRSGHRSSVACGQLRKQGFETVYNLKGGILAWQNAGLPLSRESKKEKKKRKK